MRILVTGGCGFIGSNFIRYLLEKYPGDEIVGFDLLVRGGEGFWGGTNDVEDGQG